MSELVYLVLVIDRDRTSSDEVNKALQGLPVAILHARDVAEGRTFGHGRLANSVLLDASLDDTAAPLHELLACDPALEILLMTASLSQVSVPNAIARGATAVLTKPLDPGGLRQLISEFIEQAETRRRISKLDDELVEAYQFHGIVGRSPAMLQVLSRIRRVAPQFQTVLVTGPTGAGKHLVARALHDLSPQSRGEFVVCNCPVLVEALENQRTGRHNGTLASHGEHERGLFEGAHRGTIFLDEIAELPLAAQDKLHHLLHDPQIRRVPCPAVQEEKVHFIAATKQDLGQLAIAGKFHKDLFSRLSMIEISLPPLTDRKEDLPLLQRYFLQRFSSPDAKSIRGISQRAQLTLSQYSWPGNVRELQDAIAHACLVAQSEVLDEADFPETIRSRALRSEVPDRSMITLAEVEARHLKFVLSRVHGNKARAAEILGISRASIYAMLARMRQSTSKNSLAV